MRLLEFILSIALIAHANGDVRAKDELYKRKSRSSLCLSALLIGTSFMFLFSSNDFRGHVFMRT
ncbi:hypothetical protein KP509_25G037100 [Ceratopteris richardii]|uniref:Uncharacterized protein n=1 Tax=Ceratopteris richardii TaxID=49495 RepID=A0A8T2RPB1_CERRI|nr:hypothetical protein KP509_25G037100 [Ceratopteris richardii]